MNLHEIKKGDASPSLRTSERGSKGDEASPSIYFSKQGTLQARLVKKESIDLLHLQ